MILTYRFNRLALMLGVFLAATATALLWWIAARWSLVPSLPALLASAQLLEPVAQFAEGMTLAVRAYPGLALILAAGLGVHTVIFVRAMQQGHSTRSLTQLAKGCLFILSLYLLSSGMASALESGDLADLPMQIVPLYRKMSLVVLSAAWVLFLEFYREAWQLSGRQAAQN